jgi:uncharacterized oligopeptide transporter (OPT) family protein
LVLENDLPFPEGVATAEVLKATMLGTNRKAKILFIVFGVFAGVFIKLGQGGFL